MNYRSRWKERKLKWLMIKFFNLFRFRSIYLHFSEKIILLWNILLFISLFQNWVINTQTQNTWNSFTSVAWNVWFPFFLWILLIFFFILSKNNQNKLKLYSNISFQNHSLIWFFWLFIILSVIMSISFIHWFVTFSQNIVYWNGTILWLTSWIIITVWAYMMRQHYKKNNIEIFVTETWEVKEKISNKNNMTLPF
jgi:hypothetical protein